MPAAPRTSEPVHTDVVHSEVACARRNHSSMRLVVHQRAGPVAARQDDHLGSVISSKAPVGDEGEHLRLGPLRPRLGAMNVTVAPGQAREHLVGADRVERGELVEDRDGDVHGRRS